MKTSVPVAFAFSTLVAVLSAALFWSIREAATDNWEHALTTVRIWNGEAGWPPNFLYFAVLGLLGQAIGDRTELMLSSSLILGLAVGTKAWLTLSLFDELAPEATLRARLLTTAALLVIFPVPLAFLVGATLSFYLGNIPQNVWHNSTTIALMPFALGAFLLQARDLEDGSTRRAPGILALIAIGVVIKPSFFFAYAPTTGLWLLARFRGLGPFLRGVSPILAGGLLTGLLYVAIYHLQQGSLHDEASGVSLAPLAVWKTFVPASEIPLAVVTSFLAPLTYAVLGFRPARPVWCVFALALMAVSILLFVFVTETGPRATHGNFFWQTVVCSYLLHAVLAADLLGKWVSGGARTRILACAVVLAAMALSGLVYLYRIVVLDVYLPY